MQPHAILNILVASPALGVLFVCVTAAASAQSSVLLDTMGEELNRNFSTLKAKADPAPYFLSYEVTEQSFHGVAATLGALTSDAQGKSRRLDVCVRVGSSKLDNYHRVRGERAQFTSGAALTFEDQPASIKQRIWLETDRAYRLAAERLIKIRTNSEVQVAAQDSSSDFSSEEPLADRMHMETVPQGHFAAEWAARVRNLSAKFSDYPGILTSSVSVTYLDEMKYFASSEGSRLRHGRGFARVVVSAQAKAMDGTDLATDETFEATDPGKLAARRGYRRRRGAGGPGFESVAGGAGGLAVCRARHFLGARRGGLFPRDFRPSRGRPSAEG